MTSKSFEFPVYSQPCKYFQALALVGVQKTTHSGYQSTIRRFNLSYSPSLRLWRVSKTASTRTWPYCEASVLYGSSKRRKFSTNRGKTEQTWGLEGGSRRLESLPVSRYVQLEVRGLSLASVTVQVAEIDRFEQLRTHFIISHPTLFWFFSIMLYQVCYLTLSIGHLLVLITS